MADCACSAPITDNGRLCRTCVAHLEADLRDVPGLWVELDTTRTRQDKIAVFNDRKSSGETPLAWNENAAQVASELHLTANAWALDVSRIEQDERDLLVAVDQYDVPEVARWLVRNMHTLRMHDEAGTAKEELADAVRRVRRAIDKPGVRSRFYVGPCPDLVSDATCDGDVWAFISSTEDNLSFMRCLECGANWDSTQWLRAGRDIYRRMREIESAA